MAFTKQALIKNGFQGFEPLISLPIGSARIPDQPGVYVVVASPVEAPDFLAASRGGHHKGLDPTVPLKTLREKWIPSAEMLYIGKSNNLRRRLSEFTKYGNGQPVGHRGGRYLWQLAECESLLVAWKTVSDPDDIEAEMIDEFDTRYGRLPFANLVRGRRPVATT